MKNETMNSRVDRFLEQRRAMGYTAPNVEWHLRSFARFAERHDHVGPPTMDIMRAWIREKNGPRRWTSLRIFCEYCAVTEPTTAIPGRNLTRGSRPRVEPFVYTPAQITALLKAARQLGPKGGLRGLTYATYFGLLAATGMRCGEAMRLKHEDIDWQRGSISIRDSKGNRLRVIPIHHTTLDALRAYRKVRATIPTDCAAAPLFLDDRRHKPLNHGGVNLAFHRICLRAGIASTPGRRPPRTHDLRHTFACTHLLRICRSGGDAGKALLSLSVYLGHASVRDTYWYLTGTPELFRFAARRFELNIPERKEPKHGR